MAALLLLFLFFRFREIIFRAIYLHVPAASSNAAGVLSNAAGVLSNAAGVFSDAASVFSGAAGVFSSAAGVLYNAVGVFSIAPAFTPLPLPLFQLLPPGNQHPVFFPFTSHFTSIM